MEFLIWRTPYWIRQFEIRKADIGFAISDFENPDIQSFEEIGDFFKEEMNFFQKTSMVWAIVYF